MTDRPSTALRPLHAAQVLGAVDVSVVVPTYRRPDLLARCLRALREQTLPPREVIVVMRPSDTASRELVWSQTWDKLSLVFVDAPGVLAAMRAGVACSHGAVVAFTDDDAEPRPEWLDRLLALLLQPGVGAVGGRDVITGQTNPRRLEVGKLKRYGKLVGNHHLGAGPPRDVDVLKGVNMAFRSECLALPGPGVLRGDGAEVHFEVLCAQWARRNGWRVVYDPAVEVKHTGAERIGLDRRERPAPAAVRDAAYNFLVATTALDRFRLPRQALYALALGSRDAPGVARAALAVLKGEREVLRRFAPSFSGTALALAHLISGPPNSWVVSCTDLRSSRDTGPVAL